MVELQSRRIGEHRLEDGRVIGAAGGEADEMLVAAPVGDLDEAEPVAAELEPHRLGIDGDRARAEHAFGQVFFVQMDGHDRSHKPCGRQRSMASLGGAPSPPAGAPAPCAPTC